MVNLRRITNNDKLIEQNTLSHASNFNYPHQTETTYKTKIILLKFNMKKLTKKLK